MDSKPLTASFQSDAYSEDEYDPAQDFLPKNDFHRSTRQRSRARSYQNFAYFAGFQLFLLYVYTTNILLCRDSTVEGCDFYIVHPTMITISIAHISVLRHTFPKLPRSVEHLTKYLKAQSKNYRQVPPSCQMQSALQIHHLLLRFALLPYNQIILRLRHPYHH